MRSVEEALERLVLGVSSRRHILTPSERRLVAYHESGHALVALGLPGARVPAKLSVIPRGSALGFTWELENVDQVVHVRSQLIEQLAVLLGGRTAELLVFGQPSSGAAEDLRRASAVARRMVTELGMSDAIGALSYDQAAVAQYSQQELALIGTEVKRVLDEAQRLAADVLEGARETLDDVAAALLKHEVLDRHELEAVAAQRSRRPTTGAPAL